MSGKHMCHGESDGGIRKAATGEVTEGVVFRDRTFVPRLSVLLSGSTLSATHGETVGV